MAALSKTPPHNPATCAGNMAILRGIAERNEKYANLIVNHSMFAYPHFWLWHALFDGTWLCRCWHSKEYEVKT